VLFQSSDEWNRSNCDATLRQYGSGAQRVLHPTSPGGVQQPVRPIVSPGDLRPAGGDKVLPLLCRVNGLTVINMLGFIGLLLALVWLHVVPVSVGLTILLLLSAVGIYFGWLRKR
jgi:hypothetical protein